MGVLKNRQAICWKCTQSCTGRKDPNNVVKTNFQLVRGMITNPNGGFVEVQDCWECSTCGELVPINTFRDYQVSGDIICRKERKDRR